MVFQVQCPKTKREEINEVIHGTEVRDPYRWMEDVSNQDVQDWINKQDEYKEFIFSKIPNREAALERMKEIFSIGAISTPIKRGNFIFYLRRKTEKQYILYVQDGFDGEIQELVNPNKLIKDEPIAIDWFFPSPTGNYVAYGLSKSGSEKSTLYIINVKTKVLLKGEIPHTMWVDLTWLNNESGFYYTRYPIPETVPKGEEFYNRHVFFHKIGTGWKEDPKIFGEGRSPTEIYNVILSEDNRYLRISIHIFTKNDVYLLDLKNNKLSEIIVGEDCMSYVIFSDKDMWILSNRNAPNNAIYKTSIDKPNVKNWQLVIPERNDILEDFLVTEENIFCIYMVNAVNVLKAFSLDGKETSKIKLLEFSSMFGLYMNNQLPLEDRKEFFVSVKTFFDPTIIYHYNIKEKKLTKFTEIPSPINPNDYAVKQVWYESKDKTKVSMFITHKKNIELNSKNPTLLYGYGGFNVPMKPPSFDYSLYYWLENGGIFVVANLRGGSEYGEKWHKAGMLGNKQNVFDDFIHAGKWLIENKYASNKTLAIVGGSNGGILTGAAVTQQPDLFRAVFIGVPILDMLRYHNFTVAKIWVPELGTAENPEHFKFLLDYSPYHNVKKNTQYPAIYLTTAESDTRVDPIHAIKMTGLLQWATSSDEPIILKVERQTGHGVGKPLDALAKSKTDLLTFLGWKTGMKF
ncbi:MAG: S9 family peptidase [Asgard group archaeon]|nr:S9 family peptidase [Asgard group archaeon]